MLIGTSRHKLNGPLGDRNVPKVPCDGKTSKITLKAYTHTSLSMAYEGPTSRDEPPKPTFLIEYVPQQE